MGLGMRSETIQKTVTVLAVAFILWEHISGREDWWKPAQGFETQKECVSSAEKIAPQKNRNGVPAKQDEDIPRVFRCFPSDFDFDWPTFDQNFP